MLTPTFKTLIVAGIIFFTHKSLAQNPGYKFQFNPFVGYETNILKSPSSFETDSTFQGKNELWVNAPFSGGKIAFNSFSRKKRHLFNSSIDYKKLFINPDKEINGSEFKFKMGYKLNKYKKIKNYTEFNLVNFEKSGAQDLDNLFGQPLSYSKLSFLNKLKLYPTKHIVFETKPFFNIKNYRNERYSQFGYKEPGIQQTITLRSKKKQSVFINTTLRQKNYLIVNEYYSYENPSFEEDWIEEEEFETLDSIKTIERKYNYHVFGSGFYIPFNKTTSLKIRGVYAKMYDKIQGSFGYNQMLAEAIFKTSCRKWEYNLTTTFTSKDYRDFMVKDENNEKLLLKYDYLKLNAGIKYALTKNLELSFNVLTRKRFSNIDLETRKNLRSYGLTEYRLGLIWINKGYYKKKKAI